MVFVMDNGIDSEQLRTRFRQAHDAHTLRRLAVVDVGAVRGSKHDRAKVVAYAEDRLIEAALGGLDGMFMPDMARGRN